MASSPTFHAVGIDLGTTYSAAAILTQFGRTEMLANELGSVLTESAIYFGDDEILVGHQAIQALGYDSESVVTAAKREMGQSVYSRPIRGRALPPEVLASYVLSHLRKIIEETTQGPFRVVITVPAFFDEPRRRATATAASIAGLDLLEIINEPTAAALAFGERLGYLAASGMVDRPMRVLVFDLGGGTFDVSLVELTAEQCRVLATDGDVRLGGDDWDGRLADFLATEFQARYGVDPRDKPHAADRWKRVAEQAKRTLSSRFKATVSIEAKGQSTVIGVSRKQFELLTRDLVERTIHTTSEVVAAAGANWTAIDRVVLVGGATRMPMIAQRLTELSGITPDQSVNPDEAVARGAAIYASHLLHQSNPIGHGINWKLVDVNSHSLGIQGVNLATGRDENAIIIPRNTPLPAAVTKTFVTRVPGQENIVVQVLEGEHSNPKDCISVGRAVLRDLPDDLPDGHPLHVTFAYDVGGRLKVDVSVVGNEQHLMMKWQRDRGMSEAEVATWSRLVESTRSGRDLEQLTDDPFQAADE